MGMVTNIMLFLFVASALLLTFSGCQPMPTQVTGYNKTFCFGVNTTNAYEKYMDASKSGDDLAAYRILTETVGNTLGLTIGLLAGLGLLGVVTGSFSFPNLFVVFAAFVASILASWVVIPYQVLGTLPSPIGPVLWGALSFLIIIGIVSWYHGTGEL